MAVANVETPLIFSWKSRLWLLPQSQSTMKKTSTSNPNIRTGWNLFVKFSLRAYCGWFSNSTKTKQICSTWFQSSCLCHARTNSQIFCHFLFLSFASFHHDWRLFSACKTSYWMKCEMFPDSISSTNVCFS